MKALTLIALCLWASVPSAEESAERQSRPVTQVAIMGGTIIDVATGSTVPDGVLLLNGERIARVGTRSDVQVPAEARVVDARGKWIVPGLVDMHAHISEGVNAGLPLELYLANGVTTIRDPSGNLTVLRLTRESLTSGERIGPRLFFTGPMLDGKPPVWPAGCILVDTPERAASAVTFLIDQGVDYIKVYNNVTEAALVTILRTAHARGVPVIGHVPRTLTMTRAIELGMDGLEHIRVTGRELLPKAEADKIDFLPVTERETLLWQAFDLDSPRLAQLVALLATKKIFLDPTLTTDEFYAAPSADPAKDPNNQYLPGALLRRWTSAPDVAIFTLPPELKEAARASFRKRLQFVRMLAQAGVPIVAGTDGVGLGTLLPGFGLQHELGLLADAGLTPLQALQAATITAARALKREKDLGSLAPGKFADFLLLDANPLLDVRNAARISLVVKGGLVYRPADLLKTDNRSQNGRH
ncbi:MAG: amidohydrolase family protein [Acidobacteria bacterium]|nr:amidohydrolase family protein [Acidobacteriota bacterium]